ncbi:hypothetical protein B9Q13_01560 [Candidatus Marsarchaeota G2 archaeon ECH_B_SAG-G16]|uniref:Uncharacterized protein n=1 Tax=Candidatus Marsarchaeota G2 archaeon ECH_B_SAG-G16 TaxID=1978167 RepID=A0A2R6C3W7_9ARCH|nr:MAG: hypothetical protein B9Q13_01560 [Candidatus Marsarchaeota G2 archaeon ECH_B_SAG-G16]
MVYKGGVTCKSDWELIQVVFGKNDEATDALSHVLSSFTTRDPVRKGGELSINMNKIKKIGDVP